MKPKVYRSGPKWAVRVPSGRIYLFTRWDFAVTFAIDWHFDLHMGDVGYVL